MAGKTVIGACAGLNTVLDPYQPASPSDLSKASGVRITKSNVIEVQPGTTKRVALSAGHSGFCNGGIALVADGTGLYALAPDGKTRSLLKDGLSGARIDYQQSADAVWFVNGSYAGVVADGTVFDWPVEEYNGPDTKEQFETEIPPLEHICIHNGHMLGSIGNAVFSSQPGQFGLWRMEVVALMASKVLMLASVEDGVFISDQNTTEYFQGLDPFTWERRPTKAKYPAIEWSLAIDSLKPIDFGIELDGVARVWQSSKGLCVGTTGGAFRNITESRIVFPVGTSGATLVKGFDVISTLRN